MINREERLSMALTWAMGYIVGMSTFAPDEARDSIDAAYETLRTYLDDATETAQEQDSGADSERHKAARMLGDWDPEEAMRRNSGQHDIHIRMLYQALGLGGGLGVGGTEAAIAVRDRLVELLEA